MGYVNLTSSQSAFYFSWAGLSKDFMKKKLTLSLNAVYLPKSHILVTTKGIDSQSGVEMEINITLEMITLN